MYSLTPEMYQDLASAVLQSLSNINYFNGSVSAFDGVETENDFDFALFRDVAIAL